MSIFKQYTAVSRIDIGSPTIVLPPVIADLVAPPTVIVTSLAYQFSEPSKANFTLGDAIYLNRVGSPAIHFVVGGVAYPCECQQAECTRPHGIDEVLAYFESMKVSPSLVKVQVGFGSSVYEGYLTRLDGGANATPEKEEYNFRMEILSHPSCKISGS